MDTRELVKTYGEPTVKVFAPCYSIMDGLTQEFEAHNYVLVFESPRKICLKGKLYDFSQITGYSISFNNQVTESSTKTPIGSTLGRAVIGGLLLGGVGAIIGASTAKRTTEYETEDRTIITIFTKSLDEPSIILDLILPDTERIAKIEGVLRLIKSEETQDVPTKKTPGIGDIATVKKDNKEIVVIDIVHQEGKLFYVGDDSEYYAEEDLL